MYVCMCVHNHWAPGRVAFRLKAAPVKKVRILYPLIHTSSASAHVRLQESNYRHALLHWEVCVLFPYACVYCLVCTVSSIQVPLEVTQGAALKPKNGLFVKYELRK